MRCLQPPLDAVPEGDWFCPACASAARTAAAGTTAAGTGAARGTAVA